MFRGAQKFSMTLKNSFHDAPKTFSMTLKNIFHDAQKNLSWRSKNFFMTLKKMAISILYPHRKFWRSLHRANFLEISNGRKTARMAPILTIFGPNESQRGQLNFEKKIGSSKKFPRGRKIRKAFAKSSKNFVPYTVFGTKQNRNVQMAKSSVSRCI